MDGGVADALVREVLWRVQTGSETPGHPLSFRSFATVCQTALLLRQHAVCNNTVDADAVGRYLDHGGLQVCVLSPPSQLYESLVCCSIEWSSVLKGAWSARGACVQRAFRSACRDPHSTAGLNSTSFVQFCRRVYVDARPLVGAADVAVPASGAAHLSVQVRGKPPARKQTQGRSKIGYCSVCRVGELILSRPVGWRHSAALQAALMGTRNPSSNRSLCGASQTDAGHRVHPRATQELAHAGVHRLPARAAAHRGAHDAHAPAAAGVGGAAAGPRRARDARRQGGVRAPPARAHRARARRARQGEHAAPTSRTPGERVEQGCTPLARKVATGTIPPAVGVN
jgi:hypothetical protein